MGVGFVPWVISKRIESVDKDETETDESSMDTWNRRGISRDGRGLLQVPVGARKMQFLLSI
jgi:hypothetical protein